MGGALNRSTRHQATPRQIRSNYQNRHRENSKRIKSFLGAIQYLSKYLKNLSANTDYLRKVLKEQNDWIWTDKHTEAFNELKEGFAKLPCFAHYYAQSETSLQRTPTRKNWEQLFGRNKKLAK